MQPPRRRPPPGAGLGQIRPGPAPQTPPAPQAPQAAQQPFKPEHSVGAIYRGGGQVLNNPGAVTPGAVKHAPNLFGAGPKSLSPETEARLEEIASRVPREAAVYRGPPGNGLALVQRKLRG